MAPAITGITLLAARTVLAHLIRWPEAADALWALSTVPRCAFFIAD
jgi:hypothetical protein